jgi:hypothetical protein
MKSLRKLLWIQLFLLSVLATASLLVELNPPTEFADLTTADNLNQTVSSR